MRRVNVRSYCLHMDFTYDFFMILLYPIDQQETLTSKLDEIEKSKL